MKVLRQGMSRGEQSLRVVTTSKKVRVAARVIHVVGRIGRDWVDVKIVARRKITEAGQGEEDVQLQREAGGDGLVLAVFLFFLLVCFALAAIFDKGCKYLADLK